MEEPLGDQDEMREILAPDPPAFALVHRPEAMGEDVHVLTGDMVGVPAIADLDSVGAGPGGAAAPPPEGRHDLLALLPYRQVSERGFVCHDDAAPILALRIGRQAALPRRELLALLPDTPITLENAGFDIADADYEAVVGEIAREAIGRGEGSNFVIKRSFTAELADYSHHTALSLFRRLLAGEPGSYWTFLVWTGERAFIGATPERQVSVAGGTVTMNPISGTYRYPESGPSVAEALRFLDDRKEVDELNMVVDEELKTMAPICASGGRVRGPYLKEMARLAHTEYLIDGRSSLGVSDILRATLPAPTVTGSPLENACRVIARYEPEGRGYYSGAVALIGRDGAGHPVMDSSILIRTADISAAGRLELGVGATLVRHSDPRAEVAETWAKARGMLDALGVLHDGTERPPAPPRERRPLGRNRAVRAALRERNRHLATYWFEEPEQRGRSHPDLVGRRVLVIDAEDTFTAMMDLQLRSLGLETTVRSWRSAGTGAGFSSYDLVIVGPGPGDPRLVDDPKIATLRAVAGELLAGDTPFVAVCLGHQVLASLLGLRLRRRERPNQGLQRGIDLFGTARTVGFYNTFAAVAPHDRHRGPAGTGMVDLSRDPENGEVHGVRGPGFCSVQFHPESLLTEHGPRILTELIEWARPRTPLSGHASQVRISR